MIQTQQEREAALELTGHIPRWKCHKIVSAARIAAMSSLHNEQVILDLEADDKRVRFTVSGAWAQNNVPAVGGYFVVYQDGYTAYSPAAPFEDGYARLTFKDPGGPALAG